MKKILLYEPSGTFAKFMQYLLIRLGYEVVHVDNAQQIVNEINAFKPDLIISEAHVKDLSGIDLCKIMRDEMTFASTPVAILSVDGSIETRSEALRAGCIDYLTKPLTARAIHDLVERHLPFHYKRHSLRAKIQVNADIRVGDCSETMPTLSISDGGLYVCTEKPYQIRTVVDIRLHLPGLKNPLELNGQVIYLTSDSDQALPRGMGIKFMGMDSNTETLMQHYLESYLHDYLPEALFRD